LNEEIDKLNDEERKKNRELETMRYKYSEVSLLENKVME